MHGKLGHVPDYTVSCKLQWLRSLLKMVGLRKIAQYHHRPPDGAWGLTEARGPFYRRRYAPQIPCNPYDMAEVSAYLAILAAYAVGVGRFTKRRDARLIGGARSYCI